MRPAAETGSLGLCKNDEMSTLLIAITLGAATGWAVCTYVYGQLSQTFRQNKPVVAAALAGGLSGMVGLAVVNLVVHIMST
jgi:hypothetical protein